MKQIIEWLGKNDAELIYSSSYWNDIEEEKKKEWWVKSKDDPKLFEYLNRSGLLKEFEITMKYLASENILKGNVLDAAAGVCWTSAILSKAEDIENIDAIDISFHRLNDIAPVVFEIFNANSDKIQRIAGSFYDIKRDENAYDLIIMSQAFHHADKPFELLMQCKRVLKQGGCIALIGEQPIGIFSYLKRIIKIALSKRKITFNYYELFPPDDLPGDHYYRFDDYYFLFNSLGFKLKHFESNIKNSFIFIARKV
jgi:SAM-dependent methyltransferase